MLLDLLIKHFVPLLGMVGHFGTEIIGYFRDKAKFANLTTVTQIQAQANIQAASYRKADAIHISIIILLLSLTVIYPENSDYKNWTGVAIFWLFGRLAGRFRR